MNAKVIKLKVMRKAWEIFRVGTRNFSKALKEAWKQVRALNKAIQEGVVTFWKKDGTITKRYIAPLANFYYEFKGGHSSASTVKLVDLTKFAATNDLSLSVISFHLYQIL